MVKNIKNIYWMLAYAFRILNEEYIEEKVKYEEFENVYDLLCVMLTQGINKQIKRGLERDYISKSEETTLIKGKIDISKSIKNSILKDKKLYCEYDEYSEDSYMNRIIKTAAMALIRSRNIKDDRREKNLKKAILYLKDISIIEIRSINWNILKYNSNNKTYKMLMNISYLILEGLIVNNENGEEKFSKFIDDQKMWMLYQRFILEYYRYHYPEFSARASQIKWNVEVKKEAYPNLLPKMKTDIVLKCNKKKLIIDAKYYSKALQKNPIFDKQTFRNAHINQIFVYIKNTDKDNTGDVLGMLLYAKTDSEDIGWNEYEMENNTIVLTDLDLEQDFEKIKEQLNNIAIWFQEKAKQ